MLRREAQGGSDVRRITLVVLAVAAAALVLGVPAVHAAFRTEVCLAKKRNAHGDLQKCLAVEQAKLLQGKAADVGKCAAKFQDKIAKLTKKANDAAISCRYRDNGDGTVTDYDSGLQWEQKTTTFGSGTNYGDPHDVDNTYSWSAFIKNDGTGFLDQLNGKTASGTTVTGCFAGHCDWRLPTVVELQGILLAPSPCLGVDPCIDAVFGPTAPLSNWSSTTDATFATEGWYVFFGGGNVDHRPKDFTRFVRAVRRGF
jgi:hypothetical protein